MQSPAPPHLPFWEDETKGLIFSWMEPLLKVPTWRTSGEAESDVPPQMMRTNRGWSRRLHRLLYRHTWKAAGCFLQKSCFWGVSLSSRTRAGFNELIFVWSPCRSRQRLISAQRPSHSGHVHTTSAAHQAELSGVQLRASCQQHTSRSCSRSRSSRARREGPDG